MSICYVILTCQKYLPTRCEWVKSTWLSHIRPCDTYVFLSSVPDASNHVVGWNAPDEYAGCGIKYMQLFQNFQTAADWVVLCDDDTFIFPRRLEAMLSTHSSSAPMCIGKINLGDQFLTTMSGGAGIVLSNTLYKQVSAHVSSNRGAPSPYSDVSLAVWMREVELCVYVWDRRFHSHTHRTEEEIKTAITFHYVTGELFDTYDKSSDMSLSMSAL
jgi:hypothetical protein